MKIPKTGAMLFTTLLLCTSIAFAQSPCPTDSKQHMGLFLTDVITWLNKLNKKNNNDLEEVKKYFNANMEIQHNGRTITKNYTDFYRSQMLSRKMIVNTYTHLPLQHFIMEGKQVVIHTTTSLNKPHKATEKHEVMAILEFDLCKISRWIEVSKKSRS